MFDTNHWNRLRYRLWAPVYDVAAMALRGVRRRSLVMLNVQAGERVLLLGAGTGLDLDFLPREARIAAIDITPAMIDRLRRRAERLGLEVDARVMDGQALEFADGSFDAVVLHLILAVIPDPLACAREAARVLRPGGRTAILDKFAPDGRKPPLLLRLANPFLRAVATEVTRQLGPILEAAGLRIVQEERRGPWGFFRMAVAVKGGEPVVA
jgi:ubiquinone/menaquinone biosynthesis C-methylase UbiE